MHPIIKSNRYLTLATSKKNGDVWISPLAYVFDEDNDVFYFYSDTNSKHCRYLKENASAAVAIFDSAAPSATVSGLQFDAEVKLVEIADLPQVITLYFEKLFSDPEERHKWIRPIECFQGDASQRFYTIKPLNLFINAEKDMIDYREAI